MPDTQKRLEALGIMLPEILLPKPGTDLYKWAVIACDQFTQDTNYWEKVKEIAGTSPSALNLIFPEVYLEKVTKAEKYIRIAEIKNSMNSYLNDGIFSAPLSSFIYLERYSVQHQKRRGLVLALDLERYDWESNSSPLIRSTEGTVIERLPPRINIREGAPLEIPHVLVLIDDEEDRIIPELGEIAKKNEPLYDTSLMMDSGSVKGWALDGENACMQMASAFEELSFKSKTRYGTANSDKPFLFAVGDGNHSLAAAKAVWDNYKKSHAPGSEHPSRWALVEVENLYDPGISFEPIHRIIFGCQVKEVLDLLSSCVGLKCNRGEENIIIVENDSPAIVTACLEPVLDKFVREGDYHIDYIHGEDELLRLVEDKTRQAVGIILPPIRKEDLFRTVANNGSLPRKSFSMGSAGEKRFYLECRRLF